jgi:hypothetical protein
MNPRIAGVVAIWGVLLALQGCQKGPKSGEVLDEAMAAGRDEKSFPAADEDYFRDMDRDKHGIIELTAAEARGRNNWLVWSGGNDRFWDVLSGRSVGALDLVKTLSSCPPGVGEKECGLKVSRDERWKYLGVVNEPCFERAKQPDQWGLWLDQRSADCPADPFENAEKYPGVMLCDGGKCPDGTKPTGSFYGKASGVIGLRLFPNPAFDAAAQAKWDPKRYYTDPSYYFSKDLIRPYRVGMSCAFCHVGPNPINPPADPENPKWENLSSNVGAQYFWVDRILAWEGDSSSYVYQMFHTSRPGALDTSLISTDNINNPRTMNAVYELAPRLGQAQRWGREVLAGGGLDNTQFNDFVKDGPLLALFNEPDISFSPRVLKDGSDSVGGLGALNRVFINIGLFSEEWLLHFNPLIGGKPVTPIEIAVARRNSTFWKATELQTFDLAQFFLKTTAPHYLQDAPGGAEYLGKDPAQLERGKIAFAEHCARCHSSKLPVSLPVMDESQGCSGTNYALCWNRFWAHTKTDEFKTQMREIVLHADFLTGNFLSNELRVPVTLLQTNACSPLATNAIENNIWDNFSSRSYKDLPRVGSITVHDPISGAAGTYVMPGGGRGYTRPASLISLWSTAPFLLNNTVGDLTPGGYTVDANGYSRNPDASVAARMQSFDDAIRQLLWPERRTGDSILKDGFVLKAGTDERLPGVIDRTTQLSYVRVPTGYLPDGVQKLQGFGARIAPWLFGDGGVEIGPIPVGTPINLIANLDLLGDEKAAPAAKLQHLGRVVDLLGEIKSALKELPPKQQFQLEYGAVPSAARAAYEEKMNAAAREAFLPLVPKLLAFNKCPDFVVNRGHYFGTRYLADETPLSDADKEALIEFLKTF